MLKLLWLTRVGIFEFAPALHMVEVRLSCPSPNKKSVHGSESVQPGAFEQLCFLAMLQWKKCRVPQKCLRHTNVQLPAEAHNPAKKGGIC